LQANSKLVATANLKQQFLNWRFRLAVATSSRLLYNNCRP